MRVLNVRYLPIVLGILFIRSKSALLSLVGNYRLCIDKRGC